MGKGLNLQPEIVVMPDMRIVGVLRRYTMETRGAIPAQWAEFDAVEPVEGAVPDAWYGVCANIGDDGGFDYLCGVELAKGEVPQGLAVITLPGGRWARFATKAHVSAMQDMWEEIYSDWIGKGLTPREGPSVEFYPPAFDGATGEGGYEIRVPVV
jgi:AraC family transcriptional regulator